nr:beta-ketoacyl synthase N-terminal-like domain-containing protein [Frankia sp. ArI3]
MTGVGQDGPRQETAAGEDAIAIVGVACRLPGAPGPAEFWELLRAGRDVITTTPSDRRIAGSAAAETGVAAETPDRIGRGGYLDQVAGFDAAFFGISPGRLRPWTPSSV